MSFPYIQQPLYDGCWLQIDRAKTHIDEYSKRVDGFVERDPYSMVFHHHDPGIQHAMDTITLIVRERFPRILSAIIGDAIHNLRTSLDMLMYDLVRRETRAEPPDFIKFPFAKSSDAFDATIEAGQVGLAGPDVVKELRTLRPYHGGDALLRALHDLDIIGKHHQLIAVQYYVTTGDPPVTWFLQGLTEGVKTLPLPGQHPHVEYDKELKPTLDISFGAGLPIAGKPIVPTLMEFTEMTEDIVRTFTQRFPRPDRAGFPLSEIVR